MKVEISKELSNKINEALKRLEDPNSCNCTYEEAEGYAHHVLVELQIQCVIAPYA